MASEDLTQSTPTSSYDDESIRTLSWREHIRQRPGMYIGALGDGSQAEDGIYVLFKEVVDNCVDEFNMHAGRRIDITLDELSGRVTVRDYGRGIPLGKVREVASEINTGGKFDSDNFQKSVGMNGVGLKAVNALSEFCIVASVRDGQRVEVDFSRGEMTGGNLKPLPTSEPNGTFVEFLPDREVFGDFHFRPDILRTMLSNYSYLNTGLTLVLNGEKFFSRRGLLDLLEANLGGEPLYPVIHLKGDDIEVALTHTDHYGEEYYSFVNGQYTPQGGTHLAAFREAISRTIKEYSGKGFEYSDIRSGIVAAVSVRIQEPLFDSQKKIRLQSTKVAPGKDLTINKFESDFIKKELDDYLHRHTATADAMMAKITATEKERKAMAGVAKLARERAKKVSLHNRKLRDCRIHLNDVLKPGRAKDADATDRRLLSSIFITEGDSASGTITKVRDAETQAVFSLRGKPLNAYGLARDVVYKNEEFNLLQAALNIEESIDNLRYNRVIIATDADVDGMHIRLLIISFFLRFFPELVRRGHVYILQTPLYRVKDKRTERRTRRGAKAEAIYCYDEQERVAALNSLGDNAVITRFKGLGEINQEEFADFIGAGMRLDQVKIRPGDPVDKILEFYMGKNTPERQNFIISNLREDV